MLSDKQLRRWYREYNQKWFSGELPEDTDVLYAPIEGTHGDALGHADQSVIRINPACAIDSRIIRMTLLHEMVHVALWPYNTHGARFEAEMLRLAAAGAFKGLW